MAAQAGYLKAVWRAFFGCVFEVWPPPGAREGFQKCGGRRPPPHFARLSQGSRGQTSKMHPTNPARLPSGTQSGDSKMRLNINPTRAETLTGSIPGPRGPIWL
jgi:hypothetical protein